MPPITPQDFQALLDELDRNRQARRRAWLALQGIRQRLEHWNGDKIPEPVARSFDGEGATLAIFIDRLITERQTALEELCRAIRRFQVTVFDDSRSDDRAGAHQAVLRALDRAEGLVSR